MRIKKHLAFLALILIIFSCKKKPVETVNIFKFRDYISYTTSGRVSIIDPIKINLAEEVSGWEAEQSIDAKIVKTHPYVEGSLKALNKHTLLFTPDENLEPDTEYTVTVNLADIYKKHPKRFQILYFSV